MSDVLQKICDTKRGHVEAMKAKTSLDELKEKCSLTAAPRGFIKALRHQNDAPSLITEVKKASPSKGIIREDFNPVDIAQSYERAGAACLSVLTDEPYFQGSDDIFKAVRSAVSLPMLRKDFMIDPYQIYESRALGADCILLIVAALDDVTLNDLYMTSCDLKMDVLVEVHSEEELHRAIQIRPKMIGINNRNLKTLDVDINTSVELSNMIPDNCLKVAESGIKTYSDIHNFQNHGFEAFLVGESLMKQDNIENATRTLLGK